MDYMVIMRGAWFCNAVGFLFNILQATQGTYFPLDRYKATISVDHRPGDAVLRVYALRSYIDNCTLTTYGISAISRLASPTHGDTFKINDTGWVYLLTDGASLKNSDEAFATYELDISAECPRSGIRGKTKVTIYVTDTPERKSTEECSQAVLSRKLCFGIHNHSYIIEENNEKSTYFASIRSPKFTFGCDASVKYNVIGVDTKWQFWANDKTSELKVLQALDREKKDSWTINVQCTLTFSDGNVIAGPEESMFVRVVDTDDNPPVNKDNTSQLLVKEYIIEDDNKPPQIGLLPVVHDRDISESNYTYSIRRDDLHFVTIVENDSYIMYPMKGGALDRNMPKMRIWAVKPKIRDPVDFPGNMYSCDIVITDNTFKSTHKTSYTKVMVITLLLKRPVSEIQSAVPQYNKTVYSTAGRYTQILGLEELGGSYFEILNVSTIFKIEKKRGILYVDDPVALKLASPRITLTISIKDKTEMKMSYCNVHIRIVQTRSRGIGNCSLGCSQFYRQGACEGHCGLAAPKGRCTWRAESVPRRQTKYSTCTPALVNCPDGTCDEIEKLDIKICPQDCTHNVIGEGSRRRSGGIKSASGPCWCGMTGDCTCLREYQITGIHKSTSTSPATTIGIRKHVEVFNTHQDSMETIPTVVSSPHSVIISIGTTNKTKGNDAIANLQVREFEICDKSCKTTVGVSLGCVLLLTIVFLVVWWIRRRRFQRRSETLKHVGSVASMSAIPSDYVDDRDRRVSHNSIEMFPKGAFNQMSQIDSKWEFPRNNLVLGKNLGEGEFGLVVKAEAFGIDPNDIKTTVAVKMLKNCACNSEFRDLWSEFNLLKEVNHPNVIRLLGACTLNGPILVIEEYCEHGSLRSYLQKCRSYDNPYDDKAEKGGLGQLTTRDVLLFSWQIAKGMQYLCDIKLVHRDLAARNVLVANGKVIKISDFGLTRDIYEADAYMKKSKGRIPVKWMAPESLYHQVYTSKTDVWSYGIVLWEIITLGATPYPGIPPERLYNILVTGYRMDRPDYCSEELYAVMKKTWKSEPSERPTFSSLANIFDRMLQESTGYLDLNAVLDRNHQEDDLYLENGRYLGSRNDSKPDGEVDYGSIDIVTTDDNSYLTPTTQSKLTGGDRVAPAHLEMKPRKYTGIKDTVAMINAINNKRYRVGREGESDEDCDFKETDMLRTQRL